MEIMSGHGTKVALLRPQAGEAMQIVIRPGHTYLLDFEPYTAEAALDGPDLCLSFDNGAVLSLKDFLTAASGGDFILRLPDGTQISGKDTAESLTMPLEKFHTDAVLDALCPAQQLFAEDQTVPGLPGESAGKGTEAAAPAADALRADISLTPDADGLLPWLLIHPDIL
jgi:hypothetical protein